MANGSEGSIRLEVREDLPDIVRADPAVWRARVDGRHCRTSQHFLAEIAAALSFPAYYGHNWNAFYECFGDLLDITAGGMGHEFYDRPGRPERTLHLVVRHAQNLLVDSPKRDLGVLVWKLRHPYPMYDPPQSWHRYAALQVTFVCSPATVSSFTDRLDVAGRFRHDGVA